MDKYDLSSIRTITVTGFPVGKELTRVLLEKFPQVKLFRQSKTENVVSLASHPILSLDFGSAETSCPITSTPEWKSKNGSSGILMPNFCCKVRLFFFDFKFFPAKCYELPDYKRGNWQRMWTE